MKRGLLIVLLMRSSFLTYAQNIPYEKLDSLSALISKYQLRANGLSYNNGYSDYELSFAEQNFGEFFSDQLAYTAVYKKEQGKEVMTLTENIDLTKVSGITREVFNNKVTVVTLYFPKGHLQRQVFDNGIPVDYLEFYSNNQPGDYLFKSLFDLCTLFRIEKGLTTEKAAAAEKNDLYVLSDTDFINKYPTSLLARQAAFSIAQKEKKKREEERIEKERLEKIRLEKERIAYQKYLHLW